MSAPEAAKIFFPPKTFYMYANAYGRNDGSDWLNAFNHSPAVKVTGAIYLVCDPATGDVEIVKT